MEVSSGFSLVFSKSSPARRVCTSTEGPVEIGMSLDIASIDAISEINMVTSSPQVLTVCLELTSHSC